MSIIPIDIYDSNLHLEESLAYWKEKLFLQDWIIKAKNL